MPIRIRTETIQTAAGLTGAAALAGASALHAVWAAGVSWPAANSDELADLVVGRRPMPGPVACAAVSVALAAAAGAAAHATAGRPGRLIDRSRNVATLAAAALLVRGVGGVAADAAGIGQATPEFERWNRWLYNPLCIALAVLVAVGRGRRRAHL